MSTLKQIEANRLNAQHSTGPRTTEGKSASRLNALKHGLFAADPVIPGEDPALPPPPPETPAQPPPPSAPPPPSHSTQSLPATPQEQVLLAAMVRDAWSLERSSNAETAMWNYAMEDSKDHMAVSALEERSRL